MKRRLNYGRLAILIVALLIVITLLFFLGRAVLAWLGGGGQSSAEPTSGVSTAPVPASSGGSDASSGMSTEPTSGDSSAEASTEAPSDNSKNQTVAGLDLDAQKAQIDVKTIRPNEAGEIMIIMYHGLADENSEYHRTKESFRADLQRLWEMGFRTVSMADYIESRFDVPAGTTPVLITIDDGLESTFRMIPGQDGKPMVDPDSMIGIMDDFASKHPEFGRHAILYLNGGSPFGQPEYVEQKLKYLADNGYEIGNHSSGHENLSTLDAAGVQRVLGGNVNYYEGLTGVRMDSLALPFGIFPTDANASYATKGTYEGKEYHHRAVLMVGWRPGWALYHVNSDPEALYRVQSGDGDLQLKTWLDQYEADPSLRFISDGFADVITVPESERSKIAPSAVDEKRLNFYE
ncbi:MAG: polysaccharide deacetylase family protein [Bacillota bacterium]|nr:polysaccharide deacetylase family protein [Bacillota bacterium]